MQRSPGGGSARGGRLGTNPGDVTPSLASCSGRFYRSRSSSALQTLPPYAPLWPTHGPTTSPHRPIATKKGEVFTCPWLRHSHFRKPRRTLTRKCKGQSHGHVNTSPHPRCRRSAVRPRAGMGVGGALRSERLENVQEAGTLAASGLPSVDASRPLGSEASDEAAAGRCDRREQLARARGEA